MGSSSTRKNRKNARQAALYAAVGAMTAALYVALTLLCSTVGLSSMAIQVRLSEALCILPYYFPAAVPGLFVGCLLANLLTGAVIWDVLFGSLATLVGALGARGLSRVARRAESAGLSRSARACRSLLPLPTVVANTVVVPLVLKFAYDLPDALPFLFLTVGLGEVVSAWLLGLCLLAVIRKSRVFG